MPVSSLPLPGDEEPADTSSQVGWLRSLRDHEALFQIMDADRSSAQGLEAAEALAQMGDVRGLDYLIATLNNPRSGLRMEAAEILQQLNHPRGLRALHERQTETQTSRRAGEREEVYEDLNAATTDELVAIWHENDRAQWTDLEFEVIETILAERLGTLPRRAADSTEGEDIDEEVDGRIQGLWRAGDVDSLMELLTQARDIPLRLGAAEALADLGDGGALDYLIEMLDDAEAEHSEMAAEMLDWLDLPTGNEALRDRGYVFETDAGKPIEGPQESGPGRGYSGAEPSRHPNTSQQKAEDAWMQPPPGAFAKPLAARSPSEQEQRTPSRSSVGALVTGAAGGALGFLGMLVGLDLLGIQPLPDGLREWLAPSVVYGMINSMVIGAVGGSVGRRAALAMEARAGDDVDEQDAPLALGALAGGAAFAIAVSLLRVALGD